MSMVSLLRRRAEGQAAAAAFHFIGDGELAPDTSFTYGELDRLARGIGALLAERDAVGRPVLLLYPPGPDYVAGFLGCLYAGAIAVPAYPPDPVRWDRTLPRLRALVEDCGAQIAMTVTALAELSGTVPDLAGLDWLATDQLPADAACAWAPPQTDGEVPALLQYTSGSTGAPRGVMLTHANLLHNAELVHAGFGTSPDSVGVSWLPPYHDMGLIGGVLQPIYAGFPVVLMSPMTFLQRPLTWLETIARTRATMSGGPNFAFDLCVRKSTPAQRATLDLSRWEVAFCGAEPVRADTLDRFTEAFAPAGFRREAFYPCYGLAEATLIVTGRQPPRVFGDGRVGCGHPLGDQRLVVVDPARAAPLPPGSEGEVWLAGPSVARGYWRRPDETARTFGARLAGDPDHTYLRTGDLGFLTADGELVITGRIKDLIVVRGRNVYPQDLEQAIECEVPGVRPGSTAAFPLRRGGAEQVGIAGELAAPTAAGPDTDATVAAIRQVVAQAAEVAVATVVLLRRGRVPKTSSGKIQRHACQQAAGGGEWAHGSPEVLARWDAPAGAEPAPEEQPWLARAALEPPASPPPAGVLDRTAGVLDRTAGVLDVAAGVLGLPPEAVPLAQPLTGLGLDSLRAVELQGRLESRLGLHLPVSELLAGLTVAQLADRAAAIGREPAATVEGPAVTGDAVPAERPASAGQRALWLVERRAPEQISYVVSRAARISSPLDPSRLERALRALVDRHAALRTCLPARNGEPVQRVLAWSGPVLTTHEVAGIDEQELRRRVQADADRGFDLEHGPLFRAALYSRGESDHVLLLSLHHTITDFWSLSILVDELLAGYTGDAPDAPVGAGSIVADPPDPPATEPPEESRRLRYWRQTLAGAPQALELPTTYPRPRLESFRGHTHQLRIPPATLRGLDRVARASGATRFAVLAAGFAALLARYTGNPDVVIGAPTAGRGGGQHLSLGYFVNPVPLRIPVDPTVSLRDLAARVRDVVAGALDHAVPFPTLVEELRPARDPGRTPLLQAMAVLQRPPSGRPDLGAFAVADESVSVRLGGLQLQPYRLVDTMAPFDVTLSLAEVGGHDGGALVGELSYRTDLFDAATVARLAGHLTRLLTQAAADPDRPLSTLGLMGAAERAAVLAMATGPPQPYPDRTCLDRQLWDRAAEQPDAPAVVASGARLSYRELTGLADQLARRLVREYGVRRGQLVGVHLPRGPDAIVAFWAALRAGAGYLPLPPESPPARLRWMLGDARPRVLVTHRGLSERTLDGLAPGERPQVLAMDERSTPPSGDPVADLPMVGPDDLAYVLYTSGSTGRPKGVMIPHRCASNLAHSLASGLQITPASRVFQFATCAYDVHVSDILTAHLSGAALHLPTPAAAMPGPEMVALLAGQRITHVTLSPSVLAALPDARLPALTHILCGGETCPPEVVARWGPGREFRNAYGPTETTVCVTWHVCRPERRRPPIGVPMPNSQVYVLDEQMEPVPVGVPGEIYIGGEGVGWGYLGRPDLTAARFVPDPFRPEGAARLYRTGDRARWLPEGVLEFVGRFDDQVQIRGVRVEPGEVEARLRELLAIQEVAVVPRPGPTGALELVAYLVAPPSGLAIPELRGRLRAELPEPWVPAAFVRLDALPLNTSGKLDRSALPPPAPPDRGLAGQVAPRTELEQMVAEVWATVLGQAVGVRDHFFDELGGTSLLVSRVTSELSHRLAREVPVTLLFEHPTVEALAQRLSGHAERRQPGTSPEERAARRRQALARQADGQGGAAG